MRIVLAFGSRCLRDIQAPALVVGMAAASSVLGLPAASFLVALAALLLGAWRIVRCIGRVHLLDDAVLATWTVAVAWLALVAEVLSAGHLLGSRVGWSAGCLALYLGSRVVGRADRPLDWRTPLEPVRTLGLGGRMVLGVFALPLLALAVLVWFEGITVADGLVTYLPRAVHYLQAGTFNVYTGPLDNLQYLHTILLMFPMLFLRTDVHANALSLASMGLASIGLAAFARSIGWGGTLALVAAALPWTMPKIVLSAPTSGFDILEGLWLVLGLYFLRRGYPSTSPRWLALAALAMALALATKPTFYFALPAFGVLWALCLLRGVRRARWQRAGRAAAVAAVVVMVVGAPFLVRNVALRGFLIAPTEDNALLVGQDPYALDGTAHLRTFVVTVIGMGLQFATPPFWLPESVNGRVDGWMQAVLRAFDAGPLFPAWDGLLRHGTERYHSDHAGFGGAVPLVVLPAVLLLPIVARRLGPRRIFAWWLVGLGVTYPLVLAWIVIISPNSNRYLIEWALPMAVLAPALLTAVPARVRAPLLCVLAVPLLLEMYDAVQHSRQLPPTLVTTVPREDQPYEWFGWPTNATRQAARVLNRKYPPARESDIYVYLPGYLNPEYLFTGPSLLRRVHPWVPSSEPGAVRVPGPVIMQDAALAGFLNDQPYVVVERLSADTWLLHPLDRVLVLSSVAAPDVAGEARLSLHAYASRAVFVQPEFRAVLTPPGQPEETVREYAADPQIEIPLSQAMRGSVRVDVREAGSQETRPDSYVVDRGAYASLDADLRSVRP